MKIIHRSTVLQFLTTLRTFPFLSRLVDTQFGPEGTDQKGSIRLYRGSVQGLAYYEYQLIHPLMCKKDKLTLKRDPANMYDMYAIEVWHGSFKIGYLPRCENKVLAHLMDAGKQLITEIQRVDKDSRNTWDGVLVEVRGDLDYLV